MRRPRILAVCATAALLISVTGATAATPPALVAAAAPAAVTGLSIVPGTGSAEVVIGISGDVGVMDFALDGGKRVVVDIRGATLGIPARLYDKVQRAGIANVRFAQFSAEVVRVVLELDAVREYSVVRGESDIRVTVKGPSEFEPWNVLAQGQGQGRVTSVAVKTPPAESASVRAPARPPVNGMTNPRIEMGVASAQPQGQAGRRRISVSFQDADIRDVVVQFADHSGKTIVVGPSVAGTVRATIVDQPWDVALKSILDGYGLAATEDSTGIITVDSYENLAKRASVEPLFTRIIQVNYTRAELMANTVRSLLGAGCGGGGAAGAAPAAAGDDAAAAGPPPAGGGTAVSCNARGSVGFEEKTNSVMVTETAARLADIEGYIKELDVRTPQITIKAKIITVDRTGTEQLGLAYDLGTAGTFSNALLTRAGVTGDQRVNLSGDGFAGVGNAQRSFKGASSLTLIHNMVLGGFNLTTFLDALSSVQLTDVQAEPMTTTVDNKEADLFSGTTISYLLTPPIPPGQIQSVAPQIATANIGITLRVTPHVTANRQVLLDVYAEQQVLQSVTAAGPNTSKRNTTNQVLVADGETAVIGGLTQTQVQRSRTGIPLLMDLPGLGRLFSQTEVVERKQDLLILITPHIVDEGEVVRKKP
ncbi:MAG: secretin N-terminal domain-containing protein [Gemmatimonadota bacterium]|nr:secretin N-terminal domain-containing protein [Gemmatimonadota bacterium]